MWQLKFVVTVVIVLLGLLVGCIALYRKSKSFRFRTKYFSFNCCMLFFAMGCSFVGVFHPFDVQNFHRCAGFVYRSLVRLFRISSEIQGMEIFNTLKGKNFIIVANHQSSLDMFVILEATPHRTTFLAKKALLFAPLFGFTAWLFGVVFINRGNAKSARTVMDKTAKWICDQKINLWIFPEGTRSQTGTFLPFKKGAFHLAQQYQLPIVPIVIYDYSTFFNKKNKLFEYGTMKARVLAPISTEGVTADGIPELTESVRQKMLKVFMEGDPSKSLKDTVSTEDKKIK